VLEGASIKNNSITLPISIPPIDKVIILLSASLFLDLSHVLALDARAREGSGKGCQAAFTV